MKLIDHVGCVFDDATAGKPEAAMLHACIAIDATARLLYPTTVGVGKRFMRCIREYYWLIEPMMGAGLNLEETRFDNLTIPKVTSPDFADVIYAIHRNSHAHGDEVPLSYGLIKSDELYRSSWEASADHLRIPDRVIWALTSVAVFSRVNHRQRGWGGDLYLSWGEERFTIADWWGREIDLKPIAAGWNTTRVRLAELGRLKEAVARQNDGYEEVVIVAPPPSEQGYYRGFR